MTDKEYAADCIAFLRELANNIRAFAPTTPGIHQEDADKLDEIATSLQIDTQEETK